MNREKLIAHAELYLNKNKFYYASPGCIGRIKKNRVEVIFLIPDALLPNVVVDPPDIRLWVDIDSGQIEVILQM